jgi:hypothetical protein
MEVFLARYHRQNADGVPQLMIKEVNIVSYIYDTTLVRYHRKNALLAQSRTCMYLKPVRRCIVVVLQPRITC